MIPKLITYIIKQAQIQEQEVRKSAKSEALEAIIASDPIAQKTDWGPCKRGGANFKTRELIETSLNRLEYKPTLMAKVLPGFFVMQGLMFFLGMLYLTMEETSMNFIPVILGVLGLSTVYSVWSKMTYPITFDLLNEVYWTGSRDLRSSKVKISFDEIHAIQLISERIVSNGQRAGRRRRGRSIKRVYRSIELNFILITGERVNVIDHANLDSIKSDAQRLSKILAVPVWAGV